jgi:tetratricopeptide (TPR) repeat protein
MPLPKKESLLQNVAPARADAHAGLIRASKKFKSTIPTQQIQPNQSDPTEVQAKARHGFWAIRTRWLRMRVSRYHRTTPLWLITAIYLGILAASVLVVGFTTFGNRDETKPLPPSTVPQLPSKDSKIRSLVQDTVTQIMEYRLDEAEKSLASLKALEPNHPAILSHAGAIELRRKNYDKAREYYQAVFDENPSNYLANYNLAEIDFLTHDYPGAERRLKILIRARPTNEFLRFLLFLCALLQDDETRARHVLESISRGGKSPAWHYATAALLIRENQFRQANELMAQARILYPKNSVLYDKTLKTLGIIKSDP